MENGYGVQGHYNREAAGWNVNKTDVGLRLKRCAFISPITSIVLPIAINKDYLYNFDKQNTIKNSDKSI